MEWLRENWLKAHLAVSPLGTLGVTWLLTLLVDAGQWWSNRETLELAGQTVPLGGIIYGSSVLVLEVAGRMLWVLAQRQNDMNKARGEGREAGREEGRKEGREAGREEGRREGRQQAIREMVKRGVTLPPEILESLDEPKEP